MTTVRYYLYQTTHYTVLFVGLLLLPIAVCIQYLSGYTVSKPREALTRLQQRCQEYNPDAPSEQEFERD